MYSPRAKSRETGGDPEHATSNAHDYHGRGRREDEGVIYAKADFGAAGISIRTVRRRERPDRQVGRRCPDRGIRGGRALDFGYRHPGVDVAQVKENHRQARLKRTALLLLIPAGSSPTGT